MAEEQYNPIILDFKQPNQTILNNLDCNIDWQKEIKLFLETFWNSKSFINVKTSGSTGKPKTILLEKKKILESCKMTCNYFDLDQNSTGLLCLSSHHIAGKMMIARAWKAKMRLYCVKPCSNPLNGINFPIDFCAMVPYQVRKSFSHIEKIKKLIIGGAPLFKEDIKKLKTLKTSSYLTYGMTETISHIAIRNLKEDDTYRCIGDVTIDLDSKSCLTISSPNLIGEKIIRTHDVCEKIDQKNFLWKGRYDNVINSGGIKIFPEEIEKKISDFFEDDFYIIGVKDDLLGETVSLVHKENLNDDFLEKINQRLESYKRVQKIYQQQIQKTPSGKIIRSKPKAIES